MKKLYGIIFFIFTFVGIDASWGSDEELNHNASESDKIVANNQNIHVQGQAFYKKICAKNADLADDHVQVYYKKINSNNISKPRSSLEGWSDSTVRILGKRIVVDSNGTYNYGDISFKINNLENFGSTQEVTFSGVNHAEQCYREKKEVWLPAFTSYNNIFSKESSFKKVGFWTKKLFLDATLLNSEGRPYKISIERRNEVYNPIKIQGMAVVYNKETQETKIFFDFADIAGNSIDFFYNLFTCRHKKSEVDKKIYCIHDHKLFECDARDIFGYFDTPATRQKWVPDETNFYDLKKQRVTSCLPSCYKTDGYSENHQEPFVWIFGNDAEHDSFYELDEKILFTKINSSIVSYKIKLKEYLTKQNSIELNCLKCVMKDSLETHRDVIIQEGYQSCPIGMYKRKQVGNKIVWEKIGEQELNEIKQDASENPGQEGFNSGIMPIWPQNKIAHDEVLMVSAAALFSFGIYYLAYDYLYPTIDKKLTAVIAKVILENSELYENYAISGNQESFDILVDLCMQTAGDSADQEKIEAILIKLSEQK